MDIRLIGKIKYLCHSIQSTIIEEAGTYKYIRTDIDSITHVNIISAIWMGGVASI